MSEVNPEGCKKTIASQSTSKTCLKFQHGRKSVSDSGLRTCKHKQIRSCLDPKNEKELLTSENQDSQITSRRCHLENMVDLSSPRLCSALQLANEIQAASIQKNDLHKFKSFEQNRLKEKFKQKAAKKTNIPFTEQIYKDLVDLQINDEDIVAGRSAPSKNSNFSKTKDKVFELSDFYKPDFFLEYYAKVPDQKLEIEKIQYYNGFEIYDSIESLPNLI
uniref:Protein phosphatase 1 regulatory subunit 35 C-terminal domain-containing protein n=1 Tax=Graphocephala atropunctata TaxID=36148 RepID=A0A1B6MD09_9HEMI